MRHFRTPPPSLRALTVLWLSILTGMSWGCATTPTGIECPVPIRVDEVAADEVDAVLFLIGDGGEPDLEAEGGEPVLEALKADLHAAVETFGSDRVSVVFLGDNIYPAGLPPAGHKDFDGAAERLDAQIAVFDGLPGADVGIFVPGNHDWDHDDDDGLRRVIDQGRRIVDKSRERARMLPAKGCPGPPPEPIDVGETLRVVPIDTHWWLRKDDKPKGEDCASATPEEALARLGEQLAGAGERHAVVVAHHPFASGGPHGTNRGFGLIPQDIPSKRYQGMITAIQGAFGEHPPLVYAAGHDHSLQLMKGGGLPYYVVSGSGSFDNLTKVSKLDETVFCCRSSGYMRLEFLKENRRVRLSVRTVGEEASCGGPRRPADGDEIYSTFLEP